MKPLVAALSACAHAGLIFSPSGAPSWKNPEEWETEKEFCRKISYPITYSVEDEESWTWTERDALDSAIGAMNHLIKESFGPQGVEAYFHDRRGADISWMRLKGFKLVFAPRWPFFPNPSPFHQSDQFKEIVFAGPYGTPIMEPSDPLRAEGVAHIVFQRRFRDTADFFTSPESGKRLPYLGQSIVRYNKDYWPKGHIIWFLNSHDRLWNLHKPSGPRRLHNALTEVFMHEIGHVMIAGTDHAAPPSFMSSAIQQTPSNTLPYPMIKRWMHCFEEGHMRAARMSRQLELLEKQRGAQ